MSTAALLTIVKIWKQPKCLSIDESMEMSCVYTMEYYSATKKEWNLVICDITWMNLEGMLSEISQTKTNTTDLTYMWNPKNKMNEQA